MKRLFFAINLPQNIRYQLEAVVTDLNLPDWMRQTDPRNWHITVLFLGERNEKDLEKIRIAAENAMKGFRAPRILLEKISYGPNDKESRMVWAVTDAAASRVLGDLQKKLVAELKTSGVEARTDRDFFNGHITLAKFDSGKRRPALSEKVDLEFLAETLDLMESRLSSAGSEYEVLEKFQFGVE